VLPGITFQKVGAVPALLNFISDEMPFRLFFILAHMLHALDCLYFPRSSEILLVCCSQIQYIV
jgi:hypothetical protein